ncbi:MAG: NYN domain-containing protein [Terrimesophilobacter sp.]
MAERAEGRVAVYIDFDNIVISRYTQTHGRGHRKAGNLRDITSEALRDDRELSEKLAAARVDLGAILDYASSFGTVAISRAYADWAVPVNASYQDQLVGRAVDLVQMFPTVQSMKNGADIRMSVDVVEDLFRSPEITTVVIVSGDSDFIALAQRCRRLGRYVVGIGVAGGTSRALNAACNEYKDYDALPGLDGEGDDPELDQRDRGTTEDATNSPSGGSTGHRKGTTVAAPKAETKSAAQPSARTAKPADQRAATNLLRRALELGQSKDDVDWVASSGVKTQMLRMDPTFQEKTLGYSSFTDFVKSRGNVVEIREEGQLRFLRLRGQQAADV